jgi:arsenite-transporting ATPase
MTNYIFFSGKGGVGKTTMAATTAVYNAKQGKRTLLVSTDPAGNLGDIFERSIGTEPVSLMNNLQVAQMDAQAITDAYKQRMLEPLAAILDDAMFETVKEQFNGGCTVEIATFDKFTDYLDNDGYDLIVFDTAPTGHTLRLMTLPQEWSGYIKKSSEGSGQTCIGPVSQIEDSRQKYEHAVKIMQDQTRTEIFLVSRPEKTSVYETIRAKEELERTGIHRFSLIINGVYPNHGADLGIFSKMHEMQQLNIKRLKSIAFNSVAEVPLQQGEIKGFDTIASFSNVVFNHAEMPANETFTDYKAFHGFSKPAALEVLMAKQTRDRIVVLTGKGGVGKTVAACTIASYLARKGKTLLVTTDPAAHIGQVLEATINHEIVTVAPGLSAINIEQKKAVEEYKKNILDDARKKSYSDELMTSLEEELESPCTEEIAIFEKFALLLTGGHWDYIVLDTAPTGHTLRLLELPFEYQKQIDMKLNVTTAQDNAGSQNTKIKALIQKLKDPANTTFLLVTLPEFTPIHESYRASLDLARVGINIQGVLINQLLKLEDCPPGFAFERWKMQQHYLAAATNLYHVPLFSIPMQAREIIGMKAVEKLQNDIFDQKIGK